MRVAPYQPEVHFFVCANRRDERDPLGAGCGARGEVVFGALKSKVAATRSHVRVWVTETRCLGICPRAGATVAIGGAHPAGGARVVSEVTAADVERLYDEVTGA